MIQLQSSKIYLQLNHENVIRYRKKREKDENKEFRKINIRINVKTCYWPKIILSSPAEATEKWLGGDPLSIKSS